MKGLIFFLTLLFSAISILAQTSGNAPTTKPINSKIIGDPAPQTCLVNPDGISGNNIVGKIITDSKNDYLRGGIYDGKIWRLIEMPTGIVEPKAIDENGNIVCFWRDKTSCGIFLDKNGSAFSFAVPDASETQPRGISGNIIVGSFITKKPQTEHGFAYNRKENSMTILDMPGADSTCARGTNGKIIVGSCTYLSSPMIGFYYDGKNYTKLQVPGSIGTCATGISGDTIAGWCVNGQFIFYGFSHNIKTKSFTPIQAKRGNNINTLVYCIDENKVAGTYYTRSDGWVVQDPKDHGFTYDLKTKATIFLDKTIPPAKK